MTFGTTVLKTRDADYERYPYRKVWRTAVIEILILLGIVAVVIIATTFLRIELNENQRDVFTWVFALIPLTLWFAVSYRLERQAPKPRIRLFRVLLISALASNAIAIPLTERVFTPDAWLSNASGFARIIGYMFTVSLTQEFIKYAAVRYTVWPSVIRTRIDGVAYGIAAGVGCATVLNINYALEGGHTPLAVALRMSETTLVQVAVSGIMGYLLAELKLTNSSPFGIPAGLLLASLLNALGIVVRGGLVVAGVSPTTTASTPVQGLGMGVFLVFVLFSSLNFLINNADERELLRSRVER